MAPHRDLRPRTLVAIGAVLLLIVLYGVRSGHQEEPQPADGEGMETLPPRRGRRKGTPVPQPEPDHHDEHKPQHEPREEREGEDAGQPAQEASKDPLARFPTATLVTTHGDIVWRLRPDAAPKTVANMIRHAVEGWFNGTTLYRYEKGFCLQGGGWPRKSSPHPPVPMEYKLPNRLHAVSMARGPDPDSATTEYSMMLGDNSAWLAPKPGPGGRGTSAGYAVFAEITGGLDTIARLGALPVKSNGGLHYYTTPVRLRTMRIDPAPGTTLQEFLHP